MLEIHQKKDISGYEGYLRKINANANDILIVEAFDKKNVIGFCIFSYEKDCVNLYQIEYGDDKYLFDGIVRAVLFKASMIGIDKAKYYFEDLSLLKKFGTVDKEGNCLSCIQNVMNGCNNCKKI